MASDNKKIKRIIDSLPKTPGVYKMKNAAGEIIYIGKAKNLVDRVRSYFRKDYEYSTRTRKLIENTADIEFIETGTELEAFLLENNLIKELQPRYNILLKDDKSYVYIKIDMNEDFPRVWLVREKTVEQEGIRPSPVKYFGPKLTSSKVYETLRMLKKLFPFRHCSLDIKWKKQPNEDLDVVPTLAPLGRDINGLASLRLGMVEVKNRTIDYPCLDYSIKRCPGPCIGAISPIEYKKIVQLIIDFLSGKTDEIEKSLKEQMTQAAAEKKFEKAARLRDKLTLIQNITEKQRITDLERQNTDVINFITEQDKIYFNVFMIRGGKLIGQENFILNALEIGKNADEEDFKREAIESFLPQYYEKAADIPKEILIPEEIEGKQSLEMWLNEKTDEKIIILNPKRGEKNRLLELSLKNAESSAKQYRLKWLGDQQKAEAPKRLAEILKLPKIPKRIEGFDVSHLGGKETVGSMVVFENGKPKNEHYRHFKLRTIEDKPDDYASMSEILMRRLKYLSAPGSDKLKFKMPNKKDFEEIKNIIKKEGLASNDLNKKDFLAVKKDKKITGFGRLMRLNDKISTISSLWVDSSERGNKLGYTIMKTLIKKAKIKRVYINTKKELEDYYAVFGFTVLREIPEVLQKRKEKYCRPEAISMVYDAMKHKDDASLTSKPDLIVIDGGKGQLNCGVETLKKLNLKIPVIALSKQFEEIYTPEQSAPILLEAGDEALKLLQRIRDESHRFAIIFGRKLHRKQILNPKL